MSNWLPDALPVVCDVRITADDAASMTAVLDRYGRNDVLVNNAGVEQQRVRLSRTG